MTFFLYTVNTLFMIVAVILILLVLIQKGRGGGLASAFGGVGGHTAFGSKTGDVLTWATAIVFGVFLILAVLANVVFNQVGGAKGRATAAATTPGSPTTAPAVPGSPNSSLPQGPVTADPGVADPPTLPPSKTRPETPPTDQNVRRLPNPTPAGTPAPTTRP